MAGVMEEECVQKRVCRRLHVLVPRKGFSHFDHLVSIFYIQMAAVYLVCMGT